MTSNNIRSGFLEFFERRGHRIVPSAPVIPHGDPTLLFTNAGMNQFKDLFLGQGKRDYLRAVDTQKCIRVSGKHNDLEEVGRDTYHHTFFEMLGNWSFGDYYKKEAIEWAWELLTGEWGLDKRRLFATVFETDNEAESLWKRVTDIHPDHVLRFGKKDNFWEMGETGPCGPCSEVHIDLTPDMTGHNLVNAGDPRVMEIWNLVFIQNNRTENGELEDLPQKHVDTGMGFERICAVLQGKKSNYDTDVFSPILNAVSKATGKEYGGTLDSPTDIASRVIADHIRMLTFSITDGAHPGNDGRGYVLRRILRRAARFGRSLGMHEPFIYRIAGAVVESMGNTFPELVEKQTHVEKVIKAEEEGFNATLDRGLEIFDSVAGKIDAGKVFPGDEAFKLYDTYGFPLDLTELMATERGLNVDRMRFDELMQEQKTRSRSNKPKWMAGGEYGYVSGSGNEEAARKKAESEHEKELSKSDFEYNLHVVTTQVSPLLGEELYRLPSGSYAKGVILDSTTFYYESGGQVSDTGYLTDPSNPSTTFKIEGLARKQSRTVHILTPDTSEQEFDRLMVAGIQIRTDIDVPRRLNIQRNHSATHLVHEALRRVLGTHVHQQGSLVAPDHLRFDFPHFARITPAEISVIEEMVNAKIAEDIRVETVDLPIDDARKIPNVKMFFGDKYGDRVRVVRIDERFSVEFCGGTHVISTSDIGWFKIISEGSIASGTRRIEAVTGEGIITYLNDRISQARKADEELARLNEELQSLEAKLRATTPTPGQPSRPTLGPIPEVRVSSEGIREIDQTLDGRKFALQETTDRLAQLRKEAGKSRSREVASTFTGLIDTAVSINGFKVVSSRIPADSLDQLMELGDILRSRLKSGIGILGTVINDKATFVCVVTEDLIKKKNLLAGRIVGEMARQVGGKGGGKPHLATAGGREVGKLDAALAGAAEIIRSMLLQG